MNGPRAQSGSGETNKAPHHIASIAHHFLPPSESNSNEQASSLELTVCTPEKTPVSAFAAAGLMSGFSSLVKDCEVSSENKFLKSDRELFFHENHTSKWSTASYLDALKLIRTGDDCFRGFFQSGKCSEGSWIVSDSKTPGTADDSSSSKPENGIHIHHLGQVTDHLLEWVDNRQSYPVCSKRDPGLRCGLVWCIHDSEANSLSRAHALGRLLQAMKPDALHILVFPDSWPSKVLPRWLGKIQEVSSWGKSAERPRSEEIEKLVSCLQPVRQVRASVLEASRDGQMAAISSPTMFEVARSLAAL